VARVATGTVIGEPGDGRDSRGSPPEIVRDHRRNFKQSNVDEVPGGNSYEGGTGGANAEVWERRHMSEAALERSLWLNA